VWGTLFDILAALTGVEMLGYPFMQRAYLAAVCIAVIGPLVGMYLGWWRGSTRDKTIFTGSLLMYSMPSFWISWLFIWVLNYELDFLPSAYMFTQFPEFEWTAFTVMRDVLYHLALPMISLTFIGWVGAMLIMRPSMNNVTDETYANHLSRANLFDPAVTQVNEAGRTLYLKVEAKF